jgi:Uma2 family endonuclease
MSTVTSGGESRVVLHEVSWATFQSLSREASGGRLAYDRGTLEITSPSFNHESIKKLIGRLIEIFTEVLEIDIAAAGSTTLGRQDLDRGIEADESYYFGGAPLVRGRDDIELPLDPPPDLVIEVDVTSPSVNKLEICRSLGIAEVWRYHGQRLEIHVLQADGQYRIEEASQVLPQFPIAELTRLLRLRDTKSETQIAKSFRAWVREHLAG